VDDGTSAGLPQVLAHPAGDVEGAGDVHVQLTVEIRHVRLPSRVESYHACRRDGSVQPSEMIDRSGDGSVDGSDVGHVTCRPQGPLAETVGDFPTARIDIGHYYRPAPFDDQGRRGGADAAGGASDEVGAIREDRKST